MKGTKTSESGPPGCRVWGGRQDLRGDRMFGITMSRDMIQETTSSSMVPGAHIEVAFQKLGRDVSQYLKGSGALPFDDDKRGYYHIDVMPVLPESFPEMLEALYRFQETGPEKSADIASALIENLTTKNDITNEELAWLYKIVEDGGQFELTKVLETTPGLAAALAKHRFRGDCGECGFKVPKYTGRYPKYCPECGHELCFQEKSREGQPFRYPYKPLYVGEENLREGAEYSLEVEYDGVLWHILHGREVIGNVIKSVLRGYEPTFFPGGSTKKAKTFKDQKTLKAAADIVWAAYQGKQESLELLSSSSEATYQEVEDALRILDRRIHLMKGAVLTEAVVARTFPLPEEATALQRALVGEDDGVDTSEIFEALAGYLLSSESPRFDHLVGVLFRRFPLEEGMGERLRGEVLKRGPLTKAIRSLVEMEDEDRRYFTLSKALSSCFTRVMIEGETMGGESYKFLGKHIFEMMQRALDRDLDGPSRFLNTYFLEG